MKLTIFNGSPRGKGSGSKILIEEFLRGYTETTNNSYEIFYIKELFDKPNESRNLFERAECIFIVFPLYTDTVPGIVKKFIEHLEPLTQKEKNPKICFLVQSGLIEAKHSRYVEKYLEYLAKILKSEYLGTIIKGGIEGIGKRPQSYDKEIKTGIYKIGQYFGKNYSLDKRMLKDYAKPEKLSFLQRFIFKNISRKIIHKMYWGRLMDMNGVLDKSFDTPYIAT